VGDRLRFRPRRPGFDLSTGRCLVLVTPDAQRTVHASGRAPNAGAADLDKSCRNAKVVYMEGYLFDQPAAQKAFAEEDRPCRAAGFGDTVRRLRVDRHRDAFRRLVEEHIDILFANEVEIHRSSVADFAMRCSRCAIIARSLPHACEKAVVLSGEEVHIVDAEPVGAVVDTTGAGDQFAAGFLYGYSQGQDLHSCGRIGALAAAEVIQHYGARPEADLRALMRQKLRL
jgi:sugar/nucleoside kinase (ribokinase family)